MGVFETLLVLDGRPVELDAHLARLEASLAELFPGRAAPDFDTAEIPCEDGAMRIDVIPTRDRLEPAVSFRKIAGGSERVALHSVAVAGGLGSHKWRDRALLDEAQARLGGLPLIVDADGTVLEAARANVFAVSDGRVSTPATDGRILAGVTRMRVSEIAEALDIDLRERPLNRNDLLSANEVFLTGSVRGVERVESLDGAPIRGDGEISHRIATALRRCWTDMAAVDRSHGRNEREAGEVDDQAERTRHDSRVAAPRGTSGRGRIRAGHPASSGPRSFRSGL